MATETLRPASAGSNTNLDVNAGANWAAVDESSADDWTTYVYRHWDTYSLDTYTIPDLSRSNIVIVSVTGYARLSSYTAAGVGKICAYSGGNAYYGNEEAAPLGSWNDISKQWTTDPDTAAAWTVSGVNSLEGGIACKGTQAAGSCCTQLYFVGDFYWGGGNIAGVTPANLVNRTGVAKADIVKVTGV